MKLKYLLHIVSEIDKICNSSFTSVTCILKGNRQSLQFLSLANTSALYEDIFSHHQDQRVSTHNKCLPLNLTSFKSLFSNFNDTILFTFVVSFGWFSCHSSMFKVINFSLLFVNWSLFVIYACDHQLLHFSFVVIMIINCCFSFLLILSTQELLCHICMHMIINR